MLVLLSLVIHRVNEWVNEWMNEWINEVMCKYICESDIRRMVHVHAQRCVLHEQDE
jgi:hypothetical protein